MSGSEGHDRSWQRRPDTVGDDVFRFVAGLEQGLADRYTATCVRRTAVLHRFASPGDGPDVVVKVLAEPAGAQAVFDAGMRLAALLEDGGQAAPLPIRALRPWAVADNLPAVAMPWLDDPSIRDVVTARPDRIDELMERAGVALAVVHERAAAAPGGTLAVSARTRLLTTPKAGGSGSALVRRHVDFHPHNLLVGERWLTAIDPPGGDEFTYVHHDMVNFLYKTQKNLLAGSWGTARLSGAMHLVAPTMAFFRGYFATSSRVMTDDDAKMIDRYLRLYIRLRNRDARRRRDVVQSGVFGPLLRWQVRRAFGLTAGSQHR